MGLLIAIGVPIAFLIIVLLWVIAAYNGLVSMREQVRGAWGQIDVVLKRRHDLIPNLVETVKGYAAHEKGTLEAVIAARNQAVNASGPQQTAAAEGALNTAVRQIFALSEAYPDLKANTNFLQLQGELASTETQISGMRQNYNNSVQTYNAAIQSFPNVVLAGPFGFTAAQYFELQDTAQREAPVVKF